MFKQSNLFQPGNQPFVQWVLKRYPSITLVEFVSRLDELHTAYLSQKGDQ